jgi:hypothetical protein
MSRKKTRAMAKRKRAMPAKRKDAVQRREDVLEGCNGHWTQWIKPKGAALLSQMLGPIHFVVKNHGPNSIFLAAGHGDLMDVGVGDVRATYARRVINVENRSDKAVLIEFEFLPIYIKPGPRRRARGRAVGPNNLTQTN